MGISSTPTFILPNDPNDDPLLGNDGYPHAIELQRIRTWPNDDLSSLMAYVRRRWLYPDRWDEATISDLGRPYREYTVSTGGWSGNEDLIHALESHTIFSIIGPWSWRRGGHYVYRLPRGERDGT